MWGYSKDIEGNFDSIIKEIENSWGDWNNVKEGIAYRGGSGYSYSLYAKELL